MGRTTVFAMIAKCGPVPSVYSSAQLAELNQHKSKVRIARLLNGGGYIRFHIKQWTSPEMKAITRTGIIAGIATWLLLSGFTISQMSCIAASNCGVGQLLGLKTMVLGMTLPAYLVALFVSKNKKKK